MLNETPNKKIEKIKSAPKLVVAIGMVVVGVGLIAFGVRGVISPKVYIRTPKILLNAEVADDQNERTLGLSGRNGLSANQVMLFVFDKPDTYGMWMKDMKFAIDIVWLDSNKKVVEIEANVNPDSYPRVYKPASNSQFIIELAEGRAKELGIENGQTLSW